MNLETDFKKKVIGANKKPKQHNKYYLINTFFF